MKQPGRVKSCPPFSAVGEVKETAGFSMVAVGMSEIAALIKNLERRL